MQAGMRQQTKTQPGIMQVGMMQASMTKPGIRKPDIMQPGGLQAGMKTQVDMEQSERDDGAAATVTAKALLAGEVSGKVPRLHGTVEKRGSGRGLLGTVRWKSKLLVVCAEVGCVYFDSDEISDKNRAARLMPLGDDGTKVELRADRSGGSHCFALVTPAREYLFSVPTADRAAKWVEAIQAEIEAAQQTRHVKAGKMQLDMMQSGIMQVGLMQASMSQPGIRQPEIMQPGGLQAGMKTQVDMEQSERDDGAAATVTAKALLAGEVSGKVPRLHGTVEKRGSGRGLLGTVRWKSKLLVVCAEVGCVYFDSDEISDKNRAARLMPLGDDGTKVELRADRSGGSHCFALVTPAREYLFSVPTADRAAKWVAAIQAEIEAAQHTYE